MGDTLTFIIQLFPLFSIPPSFVYWSPLTKKEKKKKRETSFYVARNIFDSNLRNYVEIWKDRDSIDLYNKDLFFVSFRARVAYKRHKNWQKKKKKESYSSRKFFASVNEQLYTKRYIHQLQVLWSLWNVNRYIYFLYAVAPRALWSRTLYSFRFPRSGPRSGWRRSLLSRCRVLIARALRCVARRNRRSHVRVTRLPCDAHPDNKFRK